MIGSINVRKEFVRSPVSVACLWNGDGCRWRAGEGSGLRVI